MLTTWGSLFDSWEFTTIRPLYNHCEAKEKSTQPAHQENHQIRDIRDTYKARLTRYFANIGWQCVTNQPIYEEKLQLNLYSNLVEIGISSILSERSNKAYPKDAPWISVKLKELIRLHHQDFYPNKYGCW